MGNKIYIFLLSFVFRIGLSRGYFYNDTPLIAAYGKNDAYLRDYYNPLQNKTLDFLRILSGSEEVNFRCRKSLERWSVAIESGQHWALKLLEATGKTVNGKLTGRAVNYGSFEHCLSFRRDESQQIDFDGKYCLVSVHSREIGEIKALSNYRQYQAALSDQSKRMIEFNVGNAHGVCMPSSCEIEEIVTVFNRVVGSFGFSALPPRRCSTPSESEPITSLQVISFLILGSFVALCLLSHFVKNRFLSNFSITDNYRIIHQHGPNINESSAFLHGTKFILTALSITTHVTGLPLAIFYSHPFGTVKEEDFSGIYRIFWARMYLFGGTMFFYGGFFAFYAWYDVVKSEKIRLTFRNYFAIRYIKVAIIALITIMITFLLPHLNDGPFYADLTSHLYSNCVRNGWKEFLLISNEQPVLEMCSIAWSISADFQLYVLNYFVIFFLITRPKLGFLLALVQCLIVSVFSLIYMRIYRIPIYYNIIQNFLYDPSLFEDSYLHSFFHNNVYTLGIICAFLVKSGTRFEVLRFRAVRLAIYLATIAVPYLTLNFINDLEQSGAEPSRTVRYLLPILSRLVIALLPFFFLYSTLTGYSNCLKKLLSLSWYVPWSRLHFSLITMQFIYFIYDIGSTRTVHPFSRLAKEKYAAIMITYLLGNLVFLFFEQPMTNLCKSYLGIKKRNEIGSEDGEQRKRS